MLKKILKLSASALLALLFLVSGAFASGKMQVQLGEKVTLQADDVRGGAFKWVVKKNKDIISTQISSLFTYTFDQQGEYNINLTVTDAGGNSKSSTIMLMAGDRYSSDLALGTLEGGSLNSPLILNYSTLPAQNGQRAVYILGNEGRVVFDMISRENILEYRVDRNIFVDSDGNGIANDDIDNVNDASYLRGGIWQTTYSATESKKITAEITVVDSQGQKARSQIEILFDSPPSKTGNVLAVLNTLPDLDSQAKKIYVQGDRGTVAFYSRPSQGDILEYRIDKNIFVDSDGDGNPENDIDNRYDDSFRTGDVWATTYEKTDQQVIAQLIVVGRGGVGSRIKREIIFTDRPIVSEPVITPEASPVIQLKADKEFVQKGSPVTFMVEGLSQSLDNYVFDWDFNGDGTPDQTVEGNNTITYIYDTPGVQSIRLHVHDLNGNEANFQLDLLVKDVAATTADFNYVIEKNKVTFTNLSVSSQNLANKNLTYTWSFGDTDQKNYEAQKDQIGVQNPVYSYFQPGTYIVTLTVVDADQVTSSKQEEILIAEGVTSEEPATSNENVSETNDAGDDTGGGSLVWTILKVILYILLAIVLLIFLIVVGLLIFLKIQNPDLIFEELIDELKIKLLGMLGIRDAMEHDIHSTDAQSMAAAYEASAREKPASRADSEEKSDIKKKSEPTSEDSKKAKTSEPDLAKQDAPMPDWLKKSTLVQPSSESSSIIEGEVVEPTPPSTTDTLASQNPGS